MMNAISNSADHFFSKTSNWDTLSVAELDALLVQYPFFSLLHLLRARKLRLEGAEEDPKDFKKTTLYFNNIPWLMYQYNQQPIFSKPAEEEAPVEDIFQELGVETSMVEEVQDQITEDFSTSSIALDIPQEYVEQPLVIEPEAMETITEPIEMVIQQEQQVAEESTEMAQNEAQVHENILENTETNEELIAGIPIEEVETEFEQLENINEIEVEETIASEEGYIKNNIEVSENNLDVETNETPVLEEEYVDTIVSMTDHFDSEGETIFKVSEEFREEGAEIHYQFPIEDLSGSDYFAAQGIKMEEEVSTPSLRLNITHNSFTGWLKAMQHIENTDQPDQTQEQTSKNSDLFSIIDNEEIEVFTETMADVYLKQGLTQKAILIFQKLSLIYPTKSAYFASRIDKINTI